MFTGIVEGTGLVRELRRVPRGARLVVDAAAVLRDGGVRIGDSVAVNGVCLTVAALDGGAFAADLSPETLARTTLSRLAPGAAVNLERPLPAAGRLGGHIVQGHVDGVARVVALRDDGEARRIEIAPPQALRKYIVDKGSVAVDGVSLTVAGTSGPRFGVALIPHTCAATTLGELEPGREVNLEVDILAKYVEQLAGPLAGRPPRRAARRKTRHAGRPDGKRRWAAAPRGSARRRR
jgi:riboflavin synthase